MSKQNYDERGLRARRGLALDRNELRHPSAPRRPPSGPTSFPLKRIDPHLQQLLDDARRLAEGK